MKTMHDLLPHSFCGSGVWGGLGWVLGTGAHKVTVDPLSGLHCHQRGFSGGAVAKNPPAKAGDSRDMGSILGSGRFPLEQEMATHSGILA